MRSKNKGMSASKKTKGIPFGLCDKMTFRAAETYKMLFSKIEMIFPEGYKNEEEESDEGFGTVPGKVIGVTSALQGEGKTTTAINLTYTIAGMGKKVILLEADMRLPSIAGYLLLNEEPGLSQLLTGKKKGMECMQQFSSEQQIRFRVITGGMIPPFPAELLQSGNMAVLIHALRRSCDYIIVDLPPVNIVADTLIVAKHLDGVLMVVRQDYCEKQAFQDAISHLKMSDVKIMGTVVNFSEGI